MWKKIRGTRIEGEEVYKKYFFFYKEKESSFVLYFSYVEVEQFSRLDLETKIC